MDHALWLLLRLRVAGSLRRLRSSMLTLKGALVASLVVVGLLPALIMGGVQAGTWSADRVDAVRRLAPLAMFALFVLNITSAAGERAISFSPAEVNFLCSGPFSRRQLLGYKLVFSLVVVLLTALFAMMFLRAYAPWLAAGYVGLVSAMMFLQLSCITVALVGSMVGAQLYKRRTRWVLAVLGGLVSLALFQVGDDLLDLAPATMLERIENTPAMGVLLAPFRWYVEMFNSTQLWPDLAHWSSLGLGLDLALLILVFVLDARYLEMAASSGEMIYAALQRVRTGGAMAVLPPRLGKPRFSLPALPWWGGSGPVAWRQLTAALRNRGRFVFFLIMVLVLVAPALINWKTSSDRSNLGTVALGCIAWLSFVMAPIIAFDFRGDLDHLEVLKTLPIPASRLVVGQLVTPILVMSLLHWEMLAALAILGQPLNVLLIAAAFVVPLNFILFGVDNLLFLWYPVRILSATAGDFQMVGRNVLLMMAKFLIIGVLGGITTLLGALAYWLVDQIHGPAWLASLTLVWLLLAGFALGLLPLLSRAFVRLDIARDIPP